MQQWGRFSVRGSMGFEELMSSLMTEVAEHVGQVLSPEVCRAMVLLGGYGRGEGGVVMTDEGERPHNNLDFLVITRGISPVEQEHLKTSVQEAIQPLAQAYGIEFDVGTVAESKLRRSPALVMWYDMRFGHKTVVGDSEFVPSLRQFSLESIPPRDVLNLLVNRGTLLVINDQLIAVRELAPEDRQRVVKHTMKAIIGYGDALLFFLGRYNWSYAEKQKRMRVCNDVPEAFRALYDEAIEFRFQPHYPAYVSRDLAAWMDELREVLAGIHLPCERMRLRCEHLMWKTYAEMAFRRAPWDDFRSPRAWAKKAVNLFRVPTTLPQGFSLSAQVGYRMLGLRGMLPALFPVVAYHLQDDEYRQLAARCLRAQSTQIDELRRAYLFMWGSAVEPPFLHLARKWDLALEPGAPP
ncbi:MAG: hypothetical protein WC655_23175 [Candidatus Hydrogenedentales bacterium]|jgi:hypothetical protein